MDNNNFRVSSMVISKEKPFLNHGSPFPIIELDSEGKKALCSFLETGDKVKTAWFDYSDLVFVSITEAGFF